MKAKYKKYLKYIGGAVAIVTLSILAEWLGQGNSSHEYSEGTGFSIKVLFYNHFPTWPVNIFIFIFFSIKNLLLF